MEAGATGRAGAGRADPAKQRGRRGARDTIPGVVAARAPVPTPHRRRRTAAAAAAQPSSCGGSDGGCVGFRPLAAVRVVAGREAQRLPDLPARLR